MGSEAMTRIEEIKQRLEAWVHWQMEAGRSIDETHVPDMRFLLEEIDRLSMELVEARKQRDQARAEAVRLRAVLEEIRNQACVCDGENAKLKMRWLIDRCQNTLASADSSGLDAIRQAQRSLATIENRCHQTIEGDRSIAKGALEALDKAFGKGV